MNRTCILERVAETRSTNDDLMARWRAGELIDPVARLAKQQTHGKGRAGRVWLSTPQDSLSFSIAFPFHKSPSELSGLSLLAGLAVIDGLCSALHTTEAALYDLGLRLKWPNDVMIGNAKLGGILIEGGQSSPAEPCWMIVGVGLNLRSAITSSPEWQSIGSDSIAALEQLLSSKHTLPDNDFIWLKLIESFEHLLTAFEVQGFAVFKERWAHWDAYRGQTVFTSVMGKDDITGTASGIDSTGAYQIQTPDGLVSIHAGDVSLRKKK